jgi:threonine synthase
VYDIISSNKKQQGATLRYCSTRDNKLSYGFEEVVLTGLAPDGGLFVPKEIPRVDGNTLDRWRNLSYVELAKEVVKIFASDLEGKTIDRLLEISYSNFSHPDIAPIKRFDRFSIMELFYGPTLSFKDYPLQFLGNLLEYLLRKRGEKVNIVGATSGDTGSAAIHSVKGKENINIFKLYPNNRVSKIQELQMITVEEENVYCLAINGTFDDCQSIVKRIFLDEEIRSRIKVTAVNSINWARILAQIVYYIWASLKSDKKSIFCVPTGNFGNVLAGFYAKRITELIEKLIVATNENDILYRFFTKGDYSVREVVPTISPAMDIQIASNFERYLYHLFNNEDVTVKKLMEEFSQKKVLLFGKDVLEKVGLDFLSGRSNDKETKKTIKEIYEKYKYIVDPHTAVGVKVLLEHEEKFKGKYNLVSVATAHPAKFPEVIEETIGKLEMPEEIRRLTEKKQRKYELPADISAVKEFILRHALR